MKIMQLKITFALLCAIALTIIPFMTQGRAMEEIECPDEFDGVELSDRQKTQLYKLEDQLVDSYNEMVPFSSEKEAKWEQLEADFERQVEALLSPQQKQQIEQLDLWADEQLAAIAPELLEDDDIEPTLTPNQEEALEALEEDYERRFQSILTPEQQQRLETLEEQFFEAIEAELPEPTAEQEARIEALIESFEQGVMQILTPEQGQQFQRNIAACDID